MRSTAAGALLLAIALPLSAGAQEPDATQELLAEAVREHERGRYAEAYALFLRVHEARPSARTQRALGKAAFELARYREALEWLEGSLVDERSPLTDEMRAEVRALIVRARAFLGRFVVRSSVADASVLVDGVPLEGDAIVLQVGDHEIVASAEGYHRLTRRLTVRGGEDETIELTLVSARAALDAGDPGEAHRVAGWTSLVAGAGLAAGGAIATAIWADSVGALNRNIELDLCWIDPSSESVAGGTAEGEAACRAQERRYRLALPFAWIGFAGGAALLATGVALILGAPSGEASAALSCGPFADAGLICAGRF